MALLSFVSMYVLMYAMVDTVANVHSNRNQAYMAGLMTAPMIIIELGLMGATYQRKRLNAVIAGVSVAMLVLMWTFIRQQVAIYDEQFLNCIEERT